MKNSFTVAAGIDVHRDTVVVSVRKKAADGDDDAVEPPLISRSPV
jgi:hypothetical protein